MIFAKILLGIIFFYQTVINKSEIERFIYNLILTQGKYTKQNIMVEYSNLPEKIVCEDHDVKLSVPEITRMVFRGNITLPIDLISNGRIVTRKYISLKIRTFDSIYVSSTNIRQFDTISIKNVDKKWLETTTFNGQEIKSENECIGKRVNKYLPSGQPLTLNFVENMPIINKGTSVRIVVKINKVLVYASGIAQQDGKVGDKIFVESNYDREKKRLRGIVLDKNTVELIR